MMFSAACISCAAVMFGFMVSGWALIYSQVASVLLGEPLGAVPKHHILRLISLFSSLCYELLLGEGTSRCLPQLATQSPFESIL